MRAKGSTSSATIRAPTRCSTTASRRPPCRRGRGISRARPQGGEHGRPDRQDRPFRRDQNRPRYADRGERHGFADRDRQPDARPEPQERAPEREADAGGEQSRRRDRFQQTHEQPEFLRRPVRRTRSENGEPGKNEPSGD